MNRIARPIGFTDTGTPEWFAMREGKMTGSRIAAALGLSPWMSPFTLYYVMTGWTSEVAEDSEPLEWGRRLEAPVIQKFADAHPHLRVNTRKTVWENIERPWQVVSPDALVTYPGVGRHGPDAVIEAKTSEHEDQWGEPGTDEVPVWIRCQILWMLDCLGLRYCHVPVLFSGRRYREFFVEYHEEDVEILRRGAVRFLERIEKRERPDIDGDDTTYELIRTFHPDIDGTTVELPQDLVDQLAVSQAVAREGNEGLMQARATIAEFMGSARIALAPGSGNAKGFKVADRRARGLDGTPYVQLVDISEKRTIADCRESA